MMGRLVGTVALIGALLVPALPAGADHIAPNGYFTDDDGSVHERNIDALRAANITVGCNPPANTLFCPNSSITRAQMATFLARALDLPPTSADYFTDDVGNIHQAAINALRQAGITSGCSSTGDRFCPDAPVTRDQMAAFLVRAFRLAPATTDYFTDDTGSIFAADINALAQAAITVGCGPQTFCPSRPVSRAEMATFLTRAIPLPIPPRGDTLLFSLPFSGVCDPLQVSCQKTIDYPRLDEYLINEGWFYRGPFAPGDEARFAAATFTVTLNNTPVTLNVGSNVTRGGTTRRSYTAIIGALDPGTYVFKGQWTWDSQVMYTTTLTLRIGG